MSEVTIRELPSAEEAREAAAHWGQELGILRVYLRRIRPDVWRVRLDPLPYYDSTEVAIDVPPRSEPPPFRRKASPL